MQQIKKSHHVPSCNRIKNETLLRSFSLIVIFNFRFALIALQLLPVNPLPPVNQLAIFLQINWLSNCLQTLFWRSRTSATMMINQPKIKTEILSYSDIFFFSLTQHWIMKRMADITTRWWAFGPTFALCPTFLSHKGNVKSDIWTYKKVEDVPQLEQPVSCLPDVHCIKRSKNDEYVVLACDGIYDVLRSRVKNKKPSEIRTHDLLITFLQ